jgi:hypothetical protein
VCYGGGVGSGQRRLMMLPDRVPLLACPAVSLPGDPEY